MQYLKVDLLCVVNTRKKKLTSLIGSASILKRSEVLKLGTIFFIYTLCSASTQNNTIRWLFVSSQWPTVKANNASKVYFMKIVIFTNEDVNISIQGFFNFRKIECKIHDFMNIYIVYSAISHFFIHSNNLLNIQTKYAYLYTKE
jgi:hypothetical protein